MSTLRFAAFMAVSMATTGLIQTTNAASMAEAMSKAITSHPEVLSAEKGRAAIGHQIDMAKAGYKPTLDITMGTGYEGSKNSSTRYRAGRPNGDNEGFKDLWRNEARVVARQMVFDGFQTKSRVAQQKNRFESATYHTMDVRNQVALRAAESYLNVLRGRELLALAQDNLSTHQSYISKIQNRVNGGRASKADVNQAVGRTAQAQANVEQAIGDLRQAEAAYLEAVGEMPNNPAKEATPFGSIPANTTAAIGEAMNNSPVIASAKADIKAANAELAEAKCRFCPRIELEGGASRNWNLDGVESINWDQYAMLYYRQNLYNGGHDVAQVKERVERVKQAQDMMEQERRQVEEAVIKAYARMDASKAKLEPLSTHVEASTSTRDAYAMQFDLGQRTLLDLLDSEVELFNARNALINGKFDLDAAAYGVLAHMGNLVPASATQVASK
ncbi:MAG: type I secretion protein TolC [Alphaproteobacteria bacterium CG_4_10_14_0_8_um_filter_53_9]|nr:MAG: type I secretion protein TolC [Alphaproteobacteria bacterium CG_4_10_14_0_8_um_filter_53_9]